MKVKVLTIFLSLLRQNSMPDVWVKDHLVQKLLSGIQRKIHTADQLLYTKVIGTCLQCFDAVGCVSGRASGP